MIRGFADTREGQIHYHAEGKGRPVLLLHQTPRSSTEYLDVIPILSKQFRVIAMDTIGYGNSYRPKKVCSVEDYTKGAVNFLDALKIKKTRVVGHHTGGVIGIELAASYPERVERLVISASPFIDAAEREKRKSWKPVDLFEAKEDGSHLVDLWNRRAAWYPKGRPDLVSRYIIDVVLAGEKAEEGHLSVGRYHMEEKLNRIKCPILVVCGTSDPYAYPHMRKIATSIKGSISKPIEGGTVAMPEQMPKEFAAAIIDFLKA